MVQLSAENGNALISFVGVTISCEIGMAPHPAKLLYLQGHITFKKILILYPSLLLDLENFVCSLQPKSEITSE